MKRLLDFKFNNEKYNVLAKTIAKYIEGTAFENRVYMTGSAIRNQLLGFNNVKGDIGLVIAAPNGGVSFATWIMHKTENGDATINIRKDAARFRLSNVEEISDLEIVARQSKKEQKHNEDRTSLLVHGTIEEDAATRGLTIDSLYYNVTEGILYDYTDHAFDDIENKVIRATTIDKVFVDDPAKLLYAMRIAVAIGGGIEKDTWVSIIKNSEQIAEIGILTLREELDKIITMARPSETIKKMLFANCLAYTWPHLEKMVDMRAMPYGPCESLFDHTMRVLDNVPQTLTARLGALFHDIGKINTEEKGYIYHQLVGAEMTEKLMRIMGYSESTIETVSTIVEHHEDLSKFMGSQVPGTKFIRKLVLQLGDAMEATLDVIDANNKSQLYGKKAKQVTLVRNAITKTIEKDAKKAAEIKQKQKLKLPINGNDIQKEFNLKPTPLIGQLLKAVEDEYKVNPDMTKDECFCVVEETLGKIY